MNENISLLIFCLVVGVFLLWFGIMIQVGRYKRWWLIRSTPIVPSSFAYVAILGGLLFLIIPGLAIYYSDPDVRGTAFITLVCPLLNVVVLLAIWRPRWLVPAWLRWLEDQHHNLLPLLREDAIRMGAWKWEKQVSTREGLAEWVEDVRCKNKLNHPDQRFIGDPHIK